MSSPLDLTEHELVGRRFGLAPLVPQYYRALYDLTVSAEHNYRWRYRGAIPTYEAFERSLHTGVLCQFAIVPSGDLGSLVGHVVGYNATLQDGYCYLAALTDNRVRGGAFEGVALFVRYLFRHWPFRKIYFETPEFNVDQISSGVRSGLFKEEGRLKKHQYFMDDYWDLLLLAAYREDMHALRDRFDALFRPGS